MENLFVACARPRNLRIIPAMESTKTFDRVLFGIMLGLLPPLVLGVFAVFLWFIPCGQKGAPASYITVGLGIGLAFDAFFLRGALRRLYSLPKLLVILAFLAYNAGIFGMFMGVPVFNILLALPAGSYWGKRILAENTAMERRPLLTKRASLFTGMVMILVCSASAAIALNDPYTADSLRSMLGLGFEVTRPMLLALIGFGGSLLVSGQYLVTRATILAALRAETLKTAER